MSPSVVLGAQARAEYPSHAVTSYPWTAENRSYSRLLTAPVRIARTAVDTRSHSGGPTENRSRSIHKTCRPSERLRLRCRPAR